ncbi:MAG: ankyrin repeat domain-containing protein [Candidatus Amoebophilus sp.]
MKFIYSLFHQFIAYIIPINLCLQSCTGLNNSIIPVKQKSAQLTQAVSFLTYNQALVDMKFVLLDFKPQFLSQEGHLVIFYQEGTQLKAKVSEKLTHGFSRPQNLPLAIEQGQSIDQVMNAAIDQRNPLIHVHLPKGNQSGRVYIGNVGLMGGSNTDSAKGKEKLTEDEPQQESNGTTQVTTNSLADEQIVSKKNHQVIGIRTLLHMAALDGNLATARSLLLSGAHINPRDKFGYTPLHLAANKGYTEIVRLLLNQGANAYAIDYNGLSALHLASLHGHMPVVNLLLQRTDVNIKDKDGYSPLFLATRSQNIHMVEVLINRGAYVNVKNKLGNTPLYEAVGKVNLDMVILLCSKGADVNVQNIYGWTPLHLAVGRCRKIVQYLIASGADINVKNDDGLTPLQLVMQERQQNYY